MGILTSIFGRATPAGRVIVADRSPFNWLHVTYNTMEELVRVSPGGKIEPAAMKSYSFGKDARSLDITFRAGEAFHDGTPLTAELVKRAFDELQRWKAPHPPGTHFNHPAGTTCEVTGRDSVRLNFPKPDGLALGKLRAAHLVSRSFWDGPGFGYKRTGSGEGRW